MTGGIRGGYIAVPRAIFADHSILADEPATELQAFLSLVADAVWKARRVRLARGAVDLQRGQLLASTRYLAERWQWPEPRVRRFLNRISGRRANDAQNNASSDPQNETQLDALIDAQPTRDGTIITIKNYDTFQKMPMPNEDRSDAHSDAQNETQYDAQTDAPLDRKSTQREEIILNNNTPIPEGIGDACTPSGYNVVSISRSKAVAVQSESIPQTPAGVVFGDCRKFLQRAAGMSADSARRMLGRWCKTHTHGQVIDAVSRAQREGAVDPVPFITACLKQTRPSSATGGAMSAITAIEEAAL
jgi:hypothetical protein